MTTKLYPDLEEKIDALYKTKERRQEVHILHEAVMKCYDDCGVHHRVKLFLEPNIMGTLGWEFKDLILNMVFTPSSQWYYKVAAGINMVKQNFREHFGICLDINKVKLFTPAVTEDTLDYALEDLISDRFSGNMPEEEMLRIGIVRNSILGHDRSLGKAAIGEGYGIVRMSKDWVKTFLHELGHIFGAQHVDDKQSIMYPEKNGITNRWDSKSKAIILKNKYQYYHKPL